MPTEEEWIRFVKDRGGYIFRPVYAPDCDKFAYDGQIAIDGNKKQIDDENVPFILQTGLIKDEPPAAMVLFSEKGRRWSGERCGGLCSAGGPSGILPFGTDDGTGPAPQRFAAASPRPRLSRRPLRGQGPGLKRSLDGYDCMSGFQLEPSTPRRDARSPHGDGARGRARVVTGSPGTDRSVEDLSGAGNGAHGRFFTFALRPTAAAMGRANPIVVEMPWKGGRKRTMAVLDLPPAVSVHKLLYGQAPEVTYPVSIHNFTEQASLPGRGQGLLQGPAGDARSGDIPDGDGPDGVTTRPSNSSLPLRPGPTRSKPRLLA